MERLCDIGTGKGFYRQMTLEKSCGQDCRQSRTLWGPAEKAVVGRQVKVQEDDGSWSEGWTVVAVYGVPVPEKLARHNSHAHTRQRKCSDI